MQRARMFGVVAGSCLALVACKQPNPSPKRQPSPLDDETTRVDQEAARQLSAVHLQAKPRDAAGLVSGAPPPPPAAAAGGERRVYSRDADFDQGSYSHVVHDVADQLRLDDRTRPWPFMWVAVSSKGTLVKLDTETGAVLAELRTAPSGQLSNPSRTAVDSLGSVWVANRDGSSVVHVGLLENHQCVDRNHNGRIDSSTGLGDVLDWTNAGGADTNGGVATAVDECIIHYTRVTSTGTRHLSVTASDDVWVSGLGNRRFDLIDGASGAIIRQEGSVGYGGYGGLIDAQGVIWSARPLLRWNSARPLDSVHVQRYEHDSYGLCLDSRGHVWNTSLHGDKILEFGPDGALLGSYAHGAEHAQGCAVDARDHVWVAHSLLDDANTVGHLLPDGRLVGNVEVGHGPTALAVDARSNIWVTNYHSRRVTRIDPRAGPVGPDAVTPVGVVDFTGADLGGLLYNYGGMTGPSWGRAPDQGAWVLVHDSGAAATNWGQVSWTGEVSGDGDIEVRVASSEDGVNFGVPVLVASGGVDLSVADGRFLRVTVSLRRASTGASPILYDLSVEAGDRAPDCSQAIPSRSRLWPPTRRFVPVTIRGVRDPEGHATTIEITQIMQDEPSDGDGDGRGRGSARAELRAERAGGRQAPGNGRVYHVSFMATDPGGRSCTGTVQVGVPYDKRSRAIDDGPSYDSTRP